MHFVKYINTLSTYYTEYKSVDETRYPMRQSTGIRHVNWYYLVSKCDNVP